MANHEALMNFASASIKKTHDVATTLAAAYYGKSPTKMLFIGASEGGREALIAVQKFPNDYDGVIAEVPLLEWTGTNLVQYEFWRALKNGGWMNPAKVRLVQGAALAACDKLDGLQDGVVAHYLGCNAAAETKALRCPGGADTGDTCLSDAQIAFVELLRSPYHYGFPFAHGKTEYPAWPTGNEAGMGAYIPFLMSPVPPSPADTGKNNIAVFTTRAVIFQDENIEPSTDLTPYKARIQEISNVFDMNDPDISAFQAHGGKLIILGHSSDYTVAAGGVFRYYRDVVATMGKAKADQVVRLYVMPGLVHFGAAARSDGSPVPNKTDILPLLDSWVGNGAAPADQIVLTSFGRDGSPVASWPMCRYGSYPNYNGTGDSKQASSFSCTEMAPGR
jgi:feruloyl esterase